MKLDNNLYEIDYLVYSSHKTGTQTMSHTLRSNGMPCIHCHMLQNHTINMDSGVFANYLRSYHARKGKKLTIVTVFREPLERHVSSFFQWHGHGEIMAGRIPNLESSIIRNKSIPELQEIFVGEIQGQTLVGRRESINEICLELNLKPSDLRYESWKKHGFIEMANYCIYSFRFDILFEESNLEQLFSQMTGRTIAKHNANMSSDKWYRDIMVEFKKDLRIPHATIIEVYQARRELINIFYPAQFDYLLSKALERYT